MQTHLIFQDLGISLLLGLLVGLQRQHVDAPLGGVRTFPLITIFGTLCALLANTYGGWVVAAGLIGVVATVVVGNLTTHSIREEHTGLTTAVALLLMYAVGAYIVIGAWWVAIAIAIGGTVSVLLQLKLQLHGIVAKLGDSDIKAIMQFVLISCIILPVLPNQTYDRYQVLNPHEIWLMVVLVVGISLGGFVVWKFFGQQAGMVLGSILGGTISSTATAVSFAKRSGTTPSSVAVASTVILISTTISLLRVIIEMAVVGQDFLLHAIVPMLTLIVVAILLSIIAWMRTRRTTESMPEQANPTELKSALVFGLLYAVILFAVAATKEHFEQSGLFVVAVLSGLTDIDAITLSTSRLVTAQRLNPDTGWRVIVAAIIANLMFKIGLVAILGHRKLLQRTVILFGILIVVGALLLVLS